MNLEVFLAFAIAAEIVLVIPGPTITLVVSKAMVHGRPSVIPLVVGVTLGDFVAMLLSLLGLGAVLTVSSVLFSVLKWTGAVYLMYLGVGLWRSDPAAGLQPRKDTHASGRSLLNGAFIVTALNPKSIAFFVAFLPQFVDHRQAALPQLAILGTAFLVMAALNAALYAVLAGRLGDAVVHNARTRRWFNRLGGTALIGAGIVTAAIKRTA